MRLGCCVGPDQITAAADAGFDFVELPTAAVLPEKPESEFRPLRDALSAAPIKPEVWSSFLPPELKVTGASVDWPRLARYANTALRRIAEVGGAVVTFGCPAARQVPEGFTRNDALGQVTDLLRVCGAAARANGLLVAVEPLSATRCNLLNSVPEAVTLARRLNMPEVGIAPSLHDMITDGHSPFDLVDASEWIAHVHVYTQDLIPPSSEDRPLHDLAEALDVADYDGRISAQPDESLTQQDLGGSFAPAHLKLAYDSLRHCFKEP